MRSRAFAPLPDQAAAPAVAPLPSRLRPGPALDPAADAAAFRRLLDGARLPLVRSSTAMPGDPETWVDLLAASCSALAPDGDGSEAGARTVRPCFAALMRWSAGRADDGKLARAVDRFTPRAKNAGATGSPRRSWDAPADLALRAAVASLPERRFAALLGACLARGASDPDPRRAAYLAFVLGDDRPDAGHALTARALLRSLAPDGIARAGQSWLVPLVADLPPSAAAVYRAGRHAVPFPGAAFGAGEAAATLLDAARAAGEPAAASLAWLLAGAPRADRGLVADTVLATREPGALAAVLPWIGDKGVRDALDAAEREDPAWAFGEELAAAVGRNAGALAGRIAAAVGQHGEVAARGWARRAGSTAAARLDRLLAARAAGTASLGAWPPALREASAGRHPPFPAWVVPAALPPPRLRGGAALPEAAVAAAVRLVAAAAKSGHHAALDELRAACTPMSLELFARGLVAAWLAGGGHHASDWAFRALLWLGGDGGAHEAGRLAAGWAGARDRKRLAVALDALAGSGTAAALLALRSLAVEGGYSALRWDARARLRACAAARGLSIDELADASAPDLGLDARGGLDLAIGARRFRVGFDEELRPHLADAGGAPRAALPKPAPGHPDAAEAAEAALRWAGLKRDAAAAARLGARRLDANRSIAA